MACLMAVFIAKLLEVINCFYARILGNNMIRNYWKVLSLVPPILIKVGPHTVYNFDDKIKFLGG